MRFDGSLSRGFQKLAGESRAIGSNSKFLALLLERLRPYKAQILIALVLLVIGAGSELAIGKALSRVIDHGFTSTNDGGIEHHFLVLYCVVLSFAAAGCARVFTVSWLGDRVEADIRTAVYNHVVGLSPAFFEVSRSGDLLSRLMSDTSVVRSMLAYSATSTLKSLFLLLGGVVLLTVTSPK